MRIIDRNVIKDRFHQYIHEHNVEGSNKAQSYFRALVLLDEILENTHLFGHRDFWSINSVAEIKELYQHALKYQKIESSIYLSHDRRLSYGRNGYYSAALKSYLEFLVLYQHELNLWNLVNETNINPYELALRLENQNLDSIEELFGDRDLDFSSIEGKEVLRETKNRVNQAFFRRLVLSDYKTTCCVTGLNIPQVLRASHIVAWVDDETNRMNPANGLCLSATYDAAFDRHLLSFDEDYRMIFSSELKAYTNNESFKKHFAVHEGKSIARPERFSPDQKFLAIHREKMPA